MRWKQAVGSIGQDASIEKGGSLLRTAMSTMTNRHATNLTDTRSLWQVAGEVLASTRPSCECRIDSDGEERNTT